MERFHQLCQKAESIITATPELEMLVPRNAFNVCFRYKVPNHLISKNEFNLKLRTDLYHSGLSLIGFGYIKSELCLRLLITNPKTDEESLHTLFKTIVEAGNKLLVAA